MFLSFVKFQFSMEILIDATVHLAVFLKYVRSQSSFEDQY